MEKGIIFDIKEFTVHDGDGIRTTVFLKGCPLRCLWCHNPEGLRTERQLMITRNGCLSCGKCLLPCSHPECQGLGRCLHACPRGLVKAVGEEVDATELASRLAEQAEFFESGVTVSGGEPTTQPAFLLELLDGLGSVDTAIETCGYTAPDIFRRAAEKVQMLYLDIKHMDSAVHQKLTGVPNEPIQRNLEMLMRGNIPYIVRVPLIPGLNDDAENLSRLAEKLSGSRLPPKVEFLPYNPFTEAKYQMAQMPFSLSHIDGNQYHPVIPEETYRRYGVCWRIL